MSQRELFLDSLTCTVLPGKLLHAKRYTPLYNQAYHHWKSVWSTVYAEAGNPGALNNENFLRQDFISILHKDLKVVSLCMSSVFNLEGAPTEDYWYLQQFPQGTLSSIERKTGLIMTGEFLSVDNDYRKSATAVSLAEINIGIILKAFKNVNADAIVNTSRMDVKVDRMCARYGFKQLTTFMRWNYECAMLLNKREWLHDHPDTKIQNRIDSLWANRNDQTAYADTDVQRRAA